MSEQIRVFIGGSQLNRWKAQIQIVEAKEWIKFLLLEANSGQLVVDIGTRTYSNEGTTCTPWSYKQVKRESLTVLSGHCPVGEEQWYCVDCKRWIPHIDGLDFHRRKDHDLVRSYTGGGVDTWLEQIATRLGIPIELHPAPAKQWPDRRLDWTKTSYCRDINCASLDSCRIPMSGETCMTLGLAQPKDKPKILKGYCSRNLDMVEDATIGYAIEAKGSCRHCGGSGLYGRHADTCPYCKGTGSYSGASFVINEMKKLKKEGYLIVI